MIVGQNTRLEIMDYKLWISKHWTAMNGNEVTISGTLSLTVGQNTGLDRPQIGKCFPPSQKTIHSRIARLPDNKVQNKVCKNPKYNFVKKPPVIRFSI